MAIAASSARRGARPLLDRLQRASAAARAGAELRRSPCSSSTASSCGRPICRSPSRGFMPITAARTGSRLRAAVGQPALVDRRSRTSSIFGVLYIGLATAIGLLLAILLDQKIRAEGVLRTIYLYPMAISFIVTGTAWKWMLNPGIGIEKLVHDWGCDELPVRLDRRTRHGDLLRRHRRRLAGLGLRHGDVPGRRCAASTARSSRRRRSTARRLSEIYWRIIIPLLRPVFLSAFVILAAPRDQELRPGGGADRRRPGLGHRAAGHLHVPDDLHPQRDGAWARRAR